MAIPSRAALSRRTILQAAGGASLATLGGLRAARAQAAQPIRIPIMFSLSGPLAQIGGAGKLGAEITVKLINAGGGVMGRTVEPLFFDDKGTPNDLIATAREIVSQGFNYLTGGLISSWFTALIPFLNETKTVWLAGTGSSPALTNDMFSRYLFPGSDNDLQRGNVLAQLAADKFPDVQAFGSAISEAASYIDSYKNFQVFAGRDYDKIGKHPRFNPPQISKLGTTDFRPALSQLAASDSDAFYNFVVGADGVTFWKQARAFDLVHKFKAVIDQTTDFSALKALKQDMPPNLWTMTLWYHGLHQDSKISNDFYREYVARTGDPLPSGYLFYGNYMVSAMLAAITHTGGKTDTDSLIDALETVHIDTIKGVQRYRREDHLMIGPVDIVHAVPGDEAPGVKILEAVTYDTATLSPPPNPGKPYKI